MEVHMEVPMILPVGERHNYQEEKCKKEKVFDYLLEVLHEKHLFFLSVIADKLKVALAAGLSEYSKATIRILAATNDEQAIAFLRLMISKELQEAPKTLFRETSLCSVLIGEYIKTVGRDYLHKSCSALLSQLASANNLDLEIDPQIVTDPTERSKHITDLLFWANSFVDSILTTPLPKQILNLCAVLREELLKVKSTEEEASRLILSAFLFLRFICVSLISPVSFGILSEPIKEKKPTRNVILVVKILQALANGSRFESYMQSINPFLDLKKQSFESFITHLYEDNSNAIPAKVPDNAFYSDCAVLIKLLASDNPDAMIRKVVSNLIESRTSSPTKFDVKEFSLIQSGIEKLTWLCTDKSLLEQAEKSLPKSELQLQNIMDTHSVSEKSKKIPGAASSSSKSTTSSSEWRMQWTQDPSKYSSTFEWFEAELMQHKFVMLISFRGSFCLFCKKYMQRWDEYVNTIHAQGGIMFGLSADTQSVASKTARKWGLHFELIGDVKNTIADYYNVTIDHEFGREYGYEHGISQPGILVVSQHKEILYYWTSVPSVQNLFGAKSRPKPLDVIREIISKQESNSRPSTPRRSSTISNPDEVVTSLKTTIASLDSEQKRQLFKSLLESEEDSLLMYRAIRPKKKQLKELSKQRRHKPRRSSSAASSDECTECGDKCTGTGTGTSNP